MSAALMARPRTWAIVPEQGGASALKLLLWLVLRLGRPASAFLILPATAWFVLAAAPARAASRAYLARALRRRPRLSDTWRHFHAFATAILDRVFLLTGRAITLEISGLEPVDALAAQGRGCILLGAHLGSFEALRAVARRSPVPVLALMFRRNAGALTRVLESLHPAVRDGVIEIGTPESMLRVRECVAAGGIVGMLADRTPGGEREIAVPFLGAPAAFPAGPFVVAGVLGAPVFLFHAVRTGPGRYHATFEPFADRILLRRSHRTQDLHDVVARFAARIEAQCRRHPYQWFNFHAFWDPAVPAPVFAEPLGRRPAIAR